MKKIKTWLAAHPCWALALATLGALGPFLFKPFNMDDPLFIWTARQILAHPLNPYDFVVNWYGSPQPMWQITENPPLAAYYMAAAGGIFGWSEPALHAAFLLPAIAVLLGTFRLAGRFCGRPMLAALTVLLTPVFLVSSTTVMCDALMLAFWVWAVVWWIEGFDKKNLWLLWVSALFMGLAGWTKYYGFCLAPLLGAYALATRDRPRGWATSFWIPLAAAGAWQAMTRLLYGHALIGEAMHYAGEFNAMFGVARRVTVLMAFSFAGGCLASAVFLAPWLWRPRILLSMGTAMALVCGLIFFGQDFQGMWPWIKGGPRTALEWQTLFWAAGGLSVLALAAADVVKHRNGASWLLALWVFGTFVFTGFFNWTVNGRSLLPMAPAVGILLARRLEGIALGRLAVPLALSALLSLAVASVDSLSASAVRSAAREVHQLHQQNGGTLFFEGHWGFQYYMSEAGEQPMNMAEPQAAGIVAAIPVNNTDLKFPNWPKERLPGGGPRFLTDMNLYVGAGFYSSVFGPAPFVFGRPQSEDVMILQNIPQKN